MKKAVLPFFTYMLFAFAVSSCKQDTASPIKNVRFDPGKLNRLQSGDACTSYSYYYGNTQKILGTIYTKQILVSFQDGVTHDEQQELIGKYGFVENLSGQINTNSAVLHTLQLVDGLNCAQVEQAIVELDKDPKISYVAPYFMADVNGSPQLLGVSNEAIVTVTPDGKDKLEQLAATYNLEVLMPLSADVYLVKVNKSSKGNALDIANALVGQDGIVHAEPDFIVSL